VTFESLDVRDGGEGERRWQDAGRPIVPSLVLDGAPTPILHRSQLASLLGLPVPPELAATTLAWDCAALLDGWIDAIEGRTIASLSAPTPSRGRSLRNLTVNVFHPFELLPGAWTTGTFPWNPDLDDEREAGLPTADAVIRYARERAGLWIAFLGEHEAALADASRQIRSPRGTIAFPDLVAQQRWHAAFHYRQVLAHLDASGERVDRRVPLERLTGLDLPAAVF
jgi:hypothetical protein